jgi:E-phenylitaconyl-CoA hydratase
LSRLWPELAADPATACVVLTGAGGAFCSGADLAARLVELPDVDELVDSALLKSLFVPVPIVAAIDGACVAGGFELALGCDVRICTPEARFGLPEPRWGIFPSGGGARKLAAEIGFARATELLLTGRLFDADEACVMGLITHVVGRDQLLDAAIDIARQIAANSPEAVRALKYYLHAAKQPGPGLSALESELVQRVRATDSDEGIRAFLEKRAPDYHQDRGR